MRELTKFEYNELARAVYKAAEGNVLAWYQVDRTRRGAIDLARIVGETHPRTEFERFSSTYSTWKMNPTPQNTQNVCLQESYTTDRTLIEKVLGIKDFLVGVYNPREVVPEILIEKDKPAKLVKVEGLGKRKDIQARVDFENWIAYLREEDRKLAEEMGFKYDSPANLSKGFNLGNTKSKIIETSTGERLYCDGCGKLINGFKGVWFSPRTGKIYDIKECSEAEGWGFFRRNPRNIHLGKAIQLYQDGKLKQSKRN